MFTVGSGGLSLALQALGFEGADDFAEWANQNAGEIDLNAIGATLAALAASLSEEEQ